MLRISMIVLSTLAACTPSPQEAALPDSSPVSATTVQNSDTSSLAVKNSAPPSLPEPSDKKLGRAALGPSPEPVTAAENPLPNPLSDLPAEARGRRTLSTAFVRVGPDGHLTVELRNGHTLVLRDVVMRARDYCGVHAAGEPMRGKYCGGYAEIVAARPGGAPASDQPDMAVSNVTARMRDPAANQ